MAKSSLLGIEPVNPVAPGHDDLALGPSDSSDSGSDVAGLESLDVEDPQAPVDQALADDAGRSLGGPDARGGGSDTAGTGERRSAGGDAGREAGDISVDRVFNPFSDGGENDDPDDPDAQLPSDVDAAALDAAALDAAALDAAAVDEAAVDAPVDDPDDTDDPDDPDEADDADDAEDTGTDTDDTDANRDHRPGRDRGR